MRKLRRNRESRQRSVRIVLGGPGETYHILPGVTIVD